MFTSAKGAAALSLLANALLVALKLGTGLAIGSVSVLSDALDSGMDLVGAFIAVAAIRLAARPADRSHPYGHGKIESVSAIVEGGLILLGASLITYEAAYRLQHGTEVGAVGLGIVAMSLSLAVNIGMSWHLLRVARRTRSPALEATAWHRASDILTSLAVLAGLVVIQVSPWKFLDPVIALGVAAFVALTAFRLFGRALRDILDASLPEKEDRIVRDVLEAHAGQFVEYHSLRSRRSGAHRQIDFHMVMPRTTTVGEAHELSDVIEAEIERRLPETVITVHIESCEVPRAVCDAECASGEKQFCRRVPYLSHEERKAVQEPSAPQEKPL